jgi:serine/threonine protein kinase
MSPEARRGQADPRADIWSWSMVLYEMVAGQLPMEAADTRNRPGNNRELNHWMSKALAPRIEDRHQSVREALIELPIVVEPSPGRKWQRLAAALIVLIAAILGYRMWINRAQVIVRVTPLTSSGNVLLTAISPDGKYASIATTAVGGQVLKIQQIDHLLERTVVAVSPNEYIGITFSPDSQYIYYVLRQRDNSKTLYRVSIEGGDSMSILHEVDTGISFSPDGRQIAFIRGHPPETPDRPFTASIGQDGCRLN